MHLMKSGLFLPDYGQKVGNDLSNVLSVALLTFIFEISVIV